MATRQLYMMGTVIDLLVDHQEAEKILDELEKRLKLYEKRFSANDPTSELMVLNHNAGIKKVVLQPELYELIKLGKENSLTSEQLNIAIGPLIQTWRIGFSDAKVPSDEVIKGLLAKTNPHNIQLDDQNKTAFLTEKGMLLDLGALAKGFIADLLVAYLKEENVTGALINLGGNVVVFGTARQHEDGLWRIGVQDPSKDRNQTRLILKVSNQSVVTSGIYERSLIKENKRYHHIIDPKTGYPVKTEVLSLTIVSKKSVDGEIWTTRLFGLPTAEIIRTLNRTSGIEGIIITTDEVILSDGIRDLM